MLSTSQNPYWDVTYYENLESAELCSVAGRERALSECCLIGLHSTDRIKLLNLPFRSADKYYT